MENEKNRYRKNVFICSPCAPTSDDPKARKIEAEQNRNRARAACRYAVMKGAIPYAPHLYFTQFLDDEIPGESNLGKKVGQGWLLNCDEVWVIGNRISKGMEAEIVLAEEHNIPVKYLIDSRGELERLIGLLFPPNEIAAKMRDWR